MIQTQIPQQPAPQNVSIPQHKFDIIVYDTDQEDGPAQQTQTPQNGIFASSANELEILYSRCGQKIKILREYDENGNLVQQNGRTAQRTNILINPQTFQPNYSSDMLTPEQAKQMGIKMLPVEMPKFPGVQQQQFVNPPRQEKTQEKPKYFSVGGVECKSIGGLIYQKQWVRVDSKNYRLISDSNNKELSLTGKHIEMLKWVVVENEDDQIDPEEQENE